jgi:hypothetical protein
MSNLLHKLLGSLTCDDVAGWRRLAHPASFLVRNLALFLLIVILWYRVELGELVYVWLSFCFIMARLSLFMPVYDNLHNWHAQAIFGERELVCRGLASLKNHQQKNLRRLKAYEIIILFGLIYGLWFFIETAVIFFSVSYFLIRIALLLFTRLIYLDSR